jgi:hypothetical protein
MLVQPAAPVAGTAAGGAPVQPFPPPLSNSGPPSTPTPAPASAAQRPQPSRPPTVRQQPDPDFSNLPPAIAESLARLAGVSRK